MQSDIFDFKSDNYVFCASCGLVFNKLTDFICPICGAVKINEK